MYKGREYHTTMTIHNSYKIAYGLTRGSDKIMRMGNNGQPEEPGYHWVNRAFQEDFDLIYSVTFDASLLENIQNLTDGDLSSVIATPKYNSDPVYVCKSCKGIKKGEELKCGGKILEMIFLLRRAKDDGRPIDLSDMLTQGGGGESKRRFVKILQTIKWVFENKALVDRLFGSEEGPPIDECRECDYYENKAPDVIIKFHVAPKANDTIRYTGHDDKIDTNYYDDWGNKYSSNPMEKTPN